MAPEDTPVTATQRVNRRTIMHGAGAMGSVLGVLSVAGCLGDDDDDVDDTDDVDDIDDTDDDDDSVDVQPGDPVPEFEFASYTVAEDPIRYETAVLATDMWEELGFEVTHNPTEIGAILDMTFSEKAHEIMGVRLGGQPQRLDPDHFLYNGFHSSTHDVDGSYNISWFQNDEYDQAVEAQRAAFDPDERQEYVYECQEILARECPQVFVMMQYRVMPLNTDRFTNENAEMPGTGLFGYWNFHEIEPADNDVETLRYGYPGGDVQTLNPWEPFPTQDVLTMNIIYDKLVQITPDADIEPWALSEVERVDGATLDVELREGMQWHDGEDVTVDDLEFTLNYGIEHDAGPAYDFIDSVDRDGDLDVRIHLDGEAAPFEIMGLGTIWLAPEHIWGDIDDPFAVDEIDRTGSGIYEFDFWEPDEQMRLELFEDHWNPANVPELLWIPADGMSPLVRALTTEELDMIVWSLALEQIDEVEEHDFLETYEIDDIAHHIITFNQRQEIFQDRALRRALALATPEEDIMEVTLGGLREDGGYAEHIDGPITPAADFWHHPDIPDEHKYRFDLDEARAVLEDAGYTWDDDGRIHFPE